MITLILWWLSLNVAFVAGTLWASRSEAPRTLYLTTDGSWSPWRN